jgi:hypothetical protein
LLADLGLSRNVGLGFLGLLLLGAELLCGIDGGPTLGSSDFRSLASALLDHVEGCSDDTSLGLDGTTGALLGDFLYGAMVHQSSISSTQYQ